MNTTTTKKKVIKKKSSLRQEITPRMRKAAKLAVENGGNVSKAMREAGYPESSAKNVRVKETKAWAELMDELMPESLVAQRHLELLNAKHLQHDTFAMGFKTEQEKRNAIEALEIEYKSAKPEEKRKIADKIENAKETLTDYDLTVLLSEAGCIVKRIAHREQCREAYYFVADNKARKDALDMVHKLRGKYAPEKDPIKLAVTITGVRVIVEKE